MKAKIDTRICLICKYDLKTQKRLGRQLNRSLHWHKDKDNGNIWVYCVGACQRGYSLLDYCKHAGISVKEFIEQDFDFKESAPNEVNRLDWPRTFVPLVDPRAAEGVAYLQSRGIKPTDNLYYDTARKGIVLPYYFDSTFCGAQIRFIEPWEDKFGNIRKIDTVPGTRLGLLFYNWSQTKLSPNTKGIIVTEGAFNALAIKQALDKKYGEYKNPFKCIALSGSGLSIHQADTLVDLVKNGYKVILAPDFDEAGKKMAKKANDKKAITHLAFTMEEKKDWNDIYMDLGDEEEFAKFFLEGVTRV